MALDIQRTEPEGLRLVGELDIASDRELADALETEIARGGDVTLDLSGLEFIDSSGVRALIRAAEALQSKGRLILRSPAPPVKRVLDLMRLDTVPNMEIVHTDEPGPA